MTLDGLILLARYKAGEVDQINGLQLELVSREVKLTQTETSMLRDYLADANRGEHNFGKTTEMLKKCCGVSVRKGNRV